jgi:orotate phosphoribosyltransferase
MSVKVTDSPTAHALQELRDRHHRLYEGQDIDAQLAGLIRDFPASKLDDWDILRILRTSQSVFFETHVEVVSGHHTATYLRFESIARIPPLITVVARDMADWIARLHEKRPVMGLVPTYSDARLLAERVAELLLPKIRLRLIVTQYNRETGKIGTEIITGEIRPGERLLVLNDVTTRGQCVSKLGRVVTDHGGVVAGMMVFARRDSGQFSLMDQLTGTYPFYYTADLSMPQWDPPECPLCQVGKPLLLSWRDMPEL